MRRRVLHVLLIVVLAAASWFVVAGRTRGDDAPPLKPAEIEIPGAITVPLSQIERWSEIPSWLAHAEMHFNPGTETNELTFRIKEPGLVLLAASFAYDGNETDEVWTDEHKSVADLMRAGWVPIGILKATTGQHYVFRRVAKVGEEFDICTRFNAGPAVFTLPEPDVKAVMELKPLVEAQRKNLLRLPPTTSAAKGQADGAASRILMLQFVEPEQNLLKIRFGIIQRELVQQAISLAAREELGVAALDSSLRDQFPEEPDCKNTPWQVLTVGQPLNVIDIGVFRQQGNEWETLWDDEIRLPANDWYERLTEIMEEKSRGEFVELLKQQGFDGKAPPAARETAPVPDEAAALLEKLTVPAQFGAVRLLHEEIRQHGESPELLGGLARGYAMLGVLTEKYWCPAHKVFKARALLYAQRAVHRWPNSPEVLENRGYVRALLGFHQTALADFAVAEQARNAADSLVKQSGGPTAARAAVWAPALEAYCRFDGEKLEEQADDKSLVAFVRLLQVMAAECSQSDRQIIQATEALLQARSDCFRAFEAGIMVTQLGFYRVTLARALDTADHELLKQYRQTPQLPATAAKLIDDMQKSRNSVLGKLFGAEQQNEIQTRLRVIKALREADQEANNRGEPSWSVLAQMLEEIDFLHAWWQIYAESELLGLPSDDTLERISPQVEHHPYADFLFSYSSDPERSKAAVERQIKSLDIATLEYHPMLQARLGWFDRDWPDRNWPVGFCNEDQVGRDLLMVLNSPKYPQLTTMQLRQVSPYMPAGVAAAITYDVGDARSKLAELEAQYAKNSAVLTAIANFHYGSRRWQDAARCYGKAAEADPSESSYWSLASAYEQLKDEENWLKTMEEYLTVEDYGLGHARAQMRLAHYYINKHYWKKARTYADAAAESYSAWGLECAANCAEAMQEWTSAEQLYRAAAERYEGEAAVWFKFCKRTGHDAPQDAVNLAMTLVQRAESNAGQAYTGGVAIVRVLNKQLSEAADDFGKAFTLYSYSYDALDAAIVLDELGQAGARDQILNRCIAMIKSLERSPMNQAWIEFCEFLKAQWAGTGNFDGDAFEKILQQVSPDQQSQFLYWVGKVLDHQGKSDDAIKYWKRCMGTYPTALGNRPHTLAGAALWEHSITPSSYKELILGKNNGEAADEPEAENKQ